MSFGFLVITRIFSKKHYILENRNCHHHQIKLDHFFAGAEHNLLWRKWWGSNPTAHDGLQGETTIINFHRILYLYKKNENDWFLIHDNLDLYFREGLRNCGTQCSNNQTFASPQNTQLFPTRTPLPYLILYIISGTYLGRPSKKPWY